MAGSQGGKGLGWDRKTTNDRRVDNEDSATRCSAQNTKPRKFAFGRKASKAAPCYTHQVDGFKAGIKHTYITSAASLPVQHVFCFSQWCHERQEIHPSREAA